MPRSIFCSIYDYTILFLDYLFEVSFRLPTKEFILDNAEKSRSIAKRMSKMRGMTESWSTPNFLFPGIGQEAISSNCYIPIRKNVANPFDDSFLDNKYWQFSRSWCQMRPNILEMSR